TTDLPTRFRDLPPVHHPCCLATTLLPGLPSPASSVASKAHQPALIHKPRPARSTGHSQLCHHLATAPSPLMPITQEGTIPCSLIILSTV
ncbi:Hypothetical predicted protein, partial [Marmota monax]